MTSAIRAWILDRDGTLVRHVPYLHEPERVELLAGVREALTYARQQGILLFLYTNQSGIHRGYYGWRELDRTQQALYQQLGFSADDFAEVCAAPETPEEPPVFRKPSGRFIPDILQKYHLLPQQCLMFGDSPVDMQTAILHGLQGIGLGTGDPVLNPDDLCVQHPQIRYCADWRAFLALLS